MRVVKTEEQVDYLSKVKKGLPDTKKKGPITNVPVEIPSCEMEPDGNDVSLAQQLRNQKEFEEELAKIMSSEPYRVMFKDGSGVKAIHFSNFASFSPKQFDFLMNSEPTDCKFAMLDGSVRSGKTRIALFKWFFICADPPSNNDLLMCANSMASVYDNMIKDMKDPAIFGPLAKLVVGNRLADTVTIVGRNVLVKGHSTADAEPKIRGLTLAGILMDEATLCHPIFFDEAQIRVGKVWGAQMIMTTNPGPPTHWLKKEHIDKKVPRKSKRWKRWTFRLKDNPSLTASTMRDLMNAVPPGPEYERKINGKWAGAEGAVFSIFDPELHVVPFEQIPRCHFIWIAIDYGVTNATVALVQGIGVDGVKYTINEFVYEAKDGMKRQHESVLVDAIVDWTGTDGWLPPHFDQNMKIRYWIVDSANPGVKERLADPKVHGLKNVLEVTEKRTVNYRISSHSQLLHEGNAKVSDRCEKRIAEYTEYVWDLPKSKATGRDIPKKENDHATDADGYGEVTMFPLYHKYLKHKTLVIPKQLTDTELATL